MNIYAFAEEFPVNITVNADKADTVKASLNLELPNEQASLVKLKKYNNKFLFPEKMPGYIGACYEIIADCSYNNAMINFEFDNKFLKSKVFNPVIYSFDEANQELIPLDTKVSENTASATVTDVSRYILLDKTAYDKAFTWQKVKSSKADKDKDGLIDCYESKIFMFNGTKVKLDKTKADTDNDGIPDGEECSINLKYNKKKNKVLVTGKFKTNPKRKDTDLDGRNDDIDLHPLCNEFTGTMYGYYDIDNASFTMDFRGFFEDSKAYNSSLSSASLILANTIYSDSAFKYTSEDSKKIKSIKKMLTYHGFTKVKNYKLKTDYNDDDLSEICIGTKKVTLNKVTKQIVAVVVRGTDGSIEEWSSNFDVGNPDSWDKECHKGFYTAEQRILKYINSYINDNIKSSSDITYWITGHSRGAAIANILAAELIDSNNEVFAYTFATPATTTNKLAEDSTYDSIFNIVNPSDIVAYLPFSDWGFKRYGKTINLDIKELGLSDIWCSYMGRDEYHAADSDFITKSLSSLVSSYAATTKEAYTYSKKGLNISDYQYRKLSDRCKQYCQIEERFDEKGAHNGYVVHTTFALFFQLLAEALAGNSYDRLNTAYLILELGDTKILKLFWLFLYAVNDDSINFTSIKKPLAEDAHAPATYYVLINYSYLNTL